LCLGWEIISVGPWCQGFPYGKNRLRNIVIFQYIENGTSGGFRQAAGPRATERAFPRSTTSGMQKKRAKYAQFVHGDARRP
jgi:hypothetical protein